MLNDDDDLDNEPEVKPPPIEHWKVAGAEGLPDEVRNGDPTELAEAKEED